MLLFLWRSSRITITFVVLTGIISGLSNATLIAFINTGLAGQLGRFASPEWFAGLAFAVVLFRIISHYFLHRFSTKMVCDLRLRISRLILDAPYPALRNIGRSTLLGHLTEDLTAIANACELYPLLCINFAVIAGCMAYLSWLSLQLAGVLAAVILFGVLTFNMFKVVPMRSLQSARDDYDSLSNAYTALTDGVRELKLHRRRTEGFFAKALADNAESYRHYSFRATIGYIWINQWIQLLYYAVIGAILFAFPVWQDIDGEIISGYVVVFLFMMSPLTILTNSLPVFSRAKVSLNKVLQLGDKLEKLASSQSGADAFLNNDFKSLVLAGVTHRFYREKENREFLFGPIDLEFRPGELVFLVGGNGSGKTTLAMLLIGLYHPEQGEIRWNGHVVDDINRDQYLQNFSVVFSDFYLFDELYGVDIEKNRLFIEDYLRRLQLNHKVEIVDGRFSSINLSQGQRKRLALLVAYLEDRPFYVFDEWAADQDPEFKHLFYTEMLPDLKARGKTVLAITHDDKYFYIADRCIKLDEGRISAVEYSFTRTDTQTPVAERADVVEEEWFDSEVQNSL